jgi:predicted sulfurtransferase
MTGKVRIGAEGINATLAGDKKDIIDYLDWLITTQAFGELQEGLAGNDLDDKSSAQYKFFKPTVGCAHVFSELSIKLVDEICPLGQSSVVLDKLSMNNHRKGKLSPEAFHALLEKKDDYVLLDTRNYYESKIGHFDSAIQPAIRKFSQFPEYIDRNKDALEGKKILTYCTGGIRCEKATAYMRQALPDTEIFMLDGGIHNYMEWWNQKEEIKDKVLWHGKNYIFDARQSLGLENGEVVGQCQFCGIPWDTYSKCSSQGCHLLVLCCDHCKANQSAIFCCTECENGGTNGLCHCEKQRRLKEVEPLGHM